MKTVALLLGCVLLGAADLRAQETPKDLKTLVVVKQALPDGKLVNPMDSPARWTITTSFVADPAAPPQPATAPPPKPAVQTVTKSGKIYFVDSVGSDGAKMTRWKDGQLQATYLPGMTSPMITNGPGNPGFVDFANSDFPELSWISARNFVGTTKLGSGQALVFKADVSTRDGRMGLLTNAHPTPSSAIALVDLATRRPLMLQVDNELLIYQFSGSADEVSLPPEVEKAFTAVRKQILRASLVPPG